MITLIIIIIVAYIIYACVKSAKPDKRCETADEQIADLPYIHFYSPFQKDKSKRFSSGELFSLSANVLETFTHKDGLLTLKMRDGKCISGALKNAEVAFAEIQNSIQINVKLSGKTVEIEKIGNFTEEQWDTMIDVLMLAGKTYGTDIFGGSHKNMKKALLVAKIIKAVSKF